MTGKGRPPLSPGTFGKIALQHVGPSRYKARARFRDFDGVTRTVARFGQDGSSAERALREALTKRIREGRLDGDTTVRQLADLWLADIQASDRSARTREHYAYIVDRYVIERIGPLRVSQVTTRVCDELLKVTAARSKAGARTVRAVLNGMFRLAVAHGAATINPVRETGKISGGKKRPRALSRAEMDDLSDRLRTLPRALPPQVDADPAEKAGLDLADLVDWMLATGCRIGEALAARALPDVDGNPLLDLEAGTWEINATAIWLKGIGSVIQERPKSAAGWRVLALPPSVVEMTRRRLDDPLRLRPETVTVLAADGRTFRQVDGARVVFPSPFAPSLRDPSNLAGDLREVLDDLGYDWVTSHTFRKTVATRLDEAGWTGRQVADQLGHANPSMTLDVYFGRKVVNGDAATALER